jgi:hypothetical protein
MDAAIVEAQSRNPDILMKLKQADADLQIRLKEMGYDSEEKILALQNADRSDARAREIAVKDKTPRILAYFTRLALIAMVAIFIFKDVPPTAHDILLILITTIANSYTGQDNFYFGSSSGSEAKTKILADQAATPGK